MMTTILECQTLDVKSRATELGLYKETVRRLVRRQVLRKLPELRRILIPKAEIKRYLETGDKAIFENTLKSGLKWLRKNHAPCIRD